MIWSLARRGLKLGMGDRAPPLMTGILIMGPYKPLRNWVDEFIPYYMEMSWELINPIAHLGALLNWHIILTHLAERANGFSTHTAITARKGNLLPKKGHK